MRVLLINPFYPISETPSPPLGLAYLAGALEEAGVDVRVLDLVVVPYSAQLLTKILDEVQPELVGITAVTMTVDHAMAVIDGVKRHHPSAVTVMGECGRCRQREEDGEGRQLLECGTNRSTTPLSQGV